MAPTAAMLLVWYHPWKPTSDSSPPPPPLAPTSGSGSTKLASSFRMNFSGRGLLDGKRRSEVPAEEKAVEESDADALEGKFQHALELSCWSL